MTTPDEYLMQRYKVEVLPFAKDDDLAVVTVGTLRDLASQIEALQADAETQYKKGWEAGLQKAAENWETWYGFDKNGVAEMCRSIAIEVYAARKDQP